MMNLLVMLTMFLGPADDPALEQRVMALSQQLRCLVCQNETIADSQADLAADLRQQIREQMRAGRSDREITQFLTDRYGDFVLYRPPVKPRTYALWFGPLALLTGGMYWLYRFLKRWSATVKNRSLSEEEHHRVNKLLRFDKNPNLDVYRSQIAEMESDLRVGLIEPEEFERDREDIARRILEDHEGGTRQVKKSLSQRERAG